MNEFASHLQWVWIIVGIVMILMEFVTPGFVICFFGAGAVLTGFFAGIFPAMPLIWQIIIFVVSGIVFTLTGRKLFRGNISGKTNDIDADDFAGQNAVVSADITPGTPGKVEFRGSFWNAVADESLPAGTPVKIVKRENLTLTVTKL